jgi:hypothetical protein
MAYQPGDNEIRHMRYLLETVQTGTGISVPRTADKRTVRKDDLYRRIVNITEHLYRHVQRITAEDLSVVLSGIDAVYASQTIDTLCEAFKQDDANLVIETARQLHSYFSVLEENNIAQILGLDAFSGEEIDVYGLIQTLGTALAEYDNHGITQLAESADHINAVNYGNLVNDLVALVNKWSRDEVLSEEQGSGPILASHCINDIIDTLQQKYGFVIEGHTK